jgi:adenosylmethionine-8-amino-7-oxononanoate aminotransferase
MTHILHRQIGGALPVAAGGKGIEIVDTAGKRYIDASGVQRCPAWATAIPQ